MVYMAVFAQNLRRLYKKIENRIIDAGVKALTGRSVPFYMENMLSIRYNIVKMIEGKNTLKEKQIMIIIRLFDRGIK